MPAIGTTKRTPSGCAEKRFYKRAKARKERRRAKRQPDCHACNIGERWNYKFQARKKANDRDRQKESCSISRSAADSRKLAGRAGDEPHRDR